MFLVKPPLTRSWLWNALNFLHLYPIVVPGENRPASGNVKLVKTPFVPGRSSGQVLFLLSVRMREYLTSPCPSADEKAVPDEYVAVVPLSR
jgi:hypothetical protein